MVLFYVYLNYRVVLFYVYLNYRVVLFYVYLNYRVVFLCLDELQGGPVLCIVKLQGGHVLCLLELQSGPVLCLGNLLGGSVLSSRSDFRFFWKFMSLYDATKAASIFFLPLVYNGRYYCWNAWCFQKGKALASVSTFFQVWNNCILICKNENILPYWRHKN